MAKMFTPGKLIVTMSFGSWSSAAGQHVGTVTRLGPAFRRRLALGEWPMANVIPRTIKNELARSRHAMAAVF